MSEVSPWVLFAVAGLALILFVPFLIYLFVGLLVFCGALELIYSSFGKELGLSLLVGSLFVGSLYLAVHSDKNGKYRNLAFSLVGLLICGYVLLERLVF